MDPPRARPKRKDLILYILVLVLVLVLASSAVFLSTWHLALVLVHLYCI